MPKTKTMKIIIFALLAVGAGVWLVSGRIFQINSNNNNMSGSNDTNSGKTDLPASEDNKKTQAPPKNNTAPGVFVSNFTSSSEITFRYPLFKGWRSRVSKENTIEYIPENGKENNIQTVEIRSIMLELTPGDEMEKNKKVNPNGISYLDEGYFSGRHKLLFFSGGYPIQITIPGLEEADFSGKKIKETIIKTFRKMDQNMKDAE